MCLDKPNENCKPIILIIRSYFICTCTYPRLRNGLFMKLSSNSFLFALTVILWSKYVRLTIGLFLENVIIFSLVLINCRSVQKKISPTKNVLLNRHAMHVKKELKLPRGKDGLFRIQ